MIIDVEYSMIEGFSLAHHLVNIHGCIFLRLDSSRAWCILSRHINFKDTQSDNEYHKIYINTVMINSQWLW